MNVREYMQQELNTLNLEILEISEEICSLLDIKTVSDYVRNSDLLIKYNEVIINLENFQHKKETLIKIKNLERIVEDMKSKKAVKEYIKNKNKLNVLVETQTILNYKYEALLTKDCKHVWYVLGENKQDRICKCLLCNKEEKRNKVIFKDYVTGESFEKEKKRHYVTYA